MSQLKEEIAVEKLTEQQVIDYLIEHPDFFDENSVLLSDMTIRHAPGGAVSLIEHQVKVLREKNQHFEEKLHEMVDAVHENQRLNMSLHRLACNLMSADGLDDILGVIDDELRHKLSTDFLTVRLFSEDDESLEQRPERFLAVNEATQRMFKKQLEDKKIQCGRIDDAQLIQLFGDDAEAIGSAAVVPLANTSTFGVLAVASGNEQHYHPGMGVDFLQQLSDLISAALSNVIKDA